MGSKCQSEEKGSVPNAGVMMPANKSLTFMVLPTLEMLSATHQCALP